MICNITFIVANDLQCNTGQDLKLQKLILNMHGTWQKDCLQSANFFPFNESKDDMTGFPLNDYEEELI